MHDVLGPTKNIHMIGIGGAGMSGIAELLMDLGYTVSGSDLKKTDVTERLKSLGATVNYGHDPRHGHEAHVVVYSSAIRPANPEIMVARANDIPVIPRAEMLAELMRLKKGIAVSGTHGKTTTTSMIGAILEEGGLDPTVIVGGRVRTKPSGARRGSGLHLVCEADESDGSFLRLSPVIAVVTNIDPEHLDHYGNFDEVRRAYAEFLSRLPFYGLAVLCADHPEVRTLALKVARRKIFYGLGRDAELAAEGVRQKGWASDFVVTWKGEPLGAIHLQIPGLHNVQNSLAAVSVGLELGVPFPKIQKGLESFHGMARRMERVLSWGGIEVVDDYGHHPEELRMTLAALRSLNPRRLLVVFQPHRYSRTRDLAGQFGPALAGVDRLWITDIYPAGEEPIAGIDGPFLVDTVRRAGVTCDFVPTIHQLAGVVQGELKAGDVFVTLGAGDVGGLAWRVAEQLAGKEVKLCS